MVTYFENLKLKKIKKKNKKAQIKIQQMAFMLLAITLFFVLVGIFVIVFKMSSLKESAQTLEENNALLLVTKLANSPEFSCGTAFGENKPDCIDADKVMILRENINKYSDFWGVSRIRIEKIYPPSEKEVLCSLENYPNCNVIEIKKGTASGYSTFVSLCRKASGVDGVYNKCEIAKLIVAQEVENA